MLVLRKLYVELGSNFIHIWLTIVSFYLAKAAKLFTCCFHVGVNLFKNLIIHRAVLTCSLTLNNDFTLWSISFVRLLLSKLFGIFILHLIARFSLRRVKGALVRRCEMVVNQQGKHFKHKVSNKTIFCS